MSNIDFTIESLGTPQIPSPLNLSTQPNDGIADFTPATARICFDPITPNMDEFFELAGPRRMIYFRGVDVVAGLVTCGGLCPGLNNVIRGIVMQLWYHYGVRRILGFRYGFRGLKSNSPDQPIELIPGMVKDIHLMGGTVLGSSRGPVPPDDMLKTLKRHDINMLFCVGGDGTMRAAKSLFELVKSTGDKIAIVGVPKTVDNDIPYIEKTFGFDTAVSIATQAIKAAHVEATGAPNGIGLVRLMGRHSGFIAASAALASRDVNLVLIPELQFRLRGERGVIAFMRDRLRQSQHAVVVVAEGAGQDQLDLDGTTDESGNVRLSDIGVYLRDTFKRELANEGVTVKYIDPSYIIRAAPANAADTIYCGQLAEEAVHAAMAGKTGMVVGMWLNRFTHVPLEAVTTGAKCISLDSVLWRNVIEATGQPSILS